MPIFEYRCQDCGEVSELLVRSDTRPACEHCGSEQLDKLMSAHSIPKAGGQAPAGATTCCGMQRTGDAPPCGSPGGCCGGH